MDNKEFIKKETLEHSATVVGVAAGAAGTVAAAGAITGASGIAGSALAAMGLSLTAATPIGWIIGGSLAGAAAFKYGSKLINKKGELSGVTNTMDNLVEARTKERLTKIGLSLTTSEQTKAIELLEKALSEEKLNKEMFNDFKLSIEAGSLTLIEIADMLCYPLPAETNPLNDVILLMRSGLAMAAADGTVDNFEVEAIFQYIEKDISIAKDDFDFLFNLEHELNSNKKINQLIFFQIAASFYKTPAVFEKILIMLKAIGQSDGEFDVKEKNLLHVAEDIFSMAKQSEIYSYNSQNIGHYVGNEVNIILPTEKTLDTYLKKSANAISSFAEGLDVNDVIAIHDSTYFGKSNEGFIITIYGIIDHENGLLLYDWILDVEVEDGNVLISNSEYSTPFIIRKLMNPDSFALYIKQFIRDEGLIHKNTIEKQQSVAIDDKTNLRAKKIAEGIVSVEEKVSKAAGLASFAMKSVKNDLSKTLQESETVDKAKDKAFGFLNKIVSKAQEISSEHLNKTDKKQFSIHPEWHLAQNGDNLGVYSLDDIFNKLNDKSLNKDNLMVWRDGMPTWLKANEVEEISSIIEEHQKTTSPSSSTPPPLPS